ncbi:UDP-glucose 4-epimerase GalE [Cognatilysobacter tabacisoli]|uniref:UDP-glucose 4-epimerase GalE n=1 Tax=Cognatilysobacter tabacisoli TaxID=2315424 RepID=UPI000E6AE509|nr:UDP-glucose 4-epimerase GalE [Lysobacter tabacisoli]
MRTLVTGGTGYVGSHTCIDLLARGHEVVIFDNLSNSSSDVVSRIEAVSGRVVSFHQGDVRDQKHLEHVMAEFRVDAVLHFAALKAVGESWTCPLAYYDNNVGGTLSLLHAMTATSAGALVFSSSATVYGEPETLPIREDAPTRATNPYARTKLMSEEIITDYGHAERGFNAAILRYFNPVGAHPSGLLGENPRGVPNNLLPFVAQVAAGEREFVRVFGGDYPTPDGTGVRDYLHVVDLARAHVDALDYLASNRRNTTVNLGTGRGHSVLEVIAAFEKACGHEIERRIVERRPGDVSSCFADTKLAEDVLGWRAQLDLDQMCADAWRWQCRVSNNKSGNSQLADSPFIASPSTLGTRS